MLVSGDNGLMSPIPIQSNWDSRWSDRCDRFPASLIHFPFGLLSTTPLCGHLLRSSVDSTIVVNPPPPPSPAAFILTLSARLNSDRESPDTTTKFRHHKVHMTRCLDAKLFRLAWTCPLPFLSCEP